MERVGPCDRGADVDRQAVELHDAGIGLQRLEPEVEVQTPFEQPAGRLRSDHYPHVGTHRVQGTQDLDLTRRMPVAVPRDVEDGNGHRGVTVSDESRAAAAAKPRRLLSSVDGAARA